MKVTIETEADDVIEALTHGPTPAVREWEIKESWYTDHDAAVLLIVNGQTFELRVTPIADGS